MLAPRSGNLSDTFRSLWKPSTHRWVKTQRFQSIPSRSLPFIGTIFCRMDSELHLTFTEPPVPPFGANPVRHSSLIRPLCKGKRQRHQRCGGGRSGKRRRHPTGAAKGRRGGFPIVIDGGLSSGETPNGSPPSTGIPRGSTFHTRFRFRRISSFWGVSRTGRKREFEFECCFRGGWG